MEKLIIFSAPSGSGKTTIVKEVLKRISNLEFSVSACSRQPREGELHGRDYYFLGIDEFRKRIENQDFIEWEEVYTNNYYGTLISEVDRIWENGNNVIFDVDVKGGINIKKRFGNNALSIFVKAPSIDEIRRRLVRRNTENAEQIEKRINKATYEMGFASDFDVVIVNDELDKAVNETVGVILEFLGEEAVSH